MHAQRVGPLADQRIAALAVVQHGAVARRQLLAMGIGRGAIGHRLRCGRLHLVHRGVYAVGHTRLSGPGLAMAAVLACGDGAALSHFSAAHHRGLRHSSAARHDVIVPVAGGRSRPGIRVHRSPGLLPEEVELVDGIPTTTTARTLLDLAAHLQRDRLQRVIDQAEVQQVFDLGEVQGVLTAHQGHPGSGVLAAVLREAGAPKLSRSDLELAFVAICREHGLPEPIVNGHVGTIEVDCLFPAQRVAVEVDHPRWHTTRLRRERDYERDRLLMIAGFHPLRFSQRQLLRDRAGVAAATRAALGLTG